MVQFKREVYAEDNFGVKHFRFAANGLPPKRACYYAPDDADRPNGSWFVVFVKNGRERVVQCRSKTHAVEAAHDWCDSEIAKAKEKV